ncbi:MAG: hypothetical protein GXZ07_01175 [Firmicutes bacterium]|nr:hypothetical protein [Bacillota bacterium]
MRREVLPRELLQYQQVVSKVVPRSPDDAIFIRNTLVYLINGNCPCPG